MTTEAQWDARWRQTTAHDRHPDTRQYPPTPGGNENPQETKRISNTYIPTWRTEDRNEEHNRYHGQRQPQPQQLSSMAGYYADTSSRLSNPDQQQRHLGGDITVTSPFDQRGTSSWHSLPLSPHAHPTFSSTHAPLTLKIPEIQDMSDLSRASTEKPSYLGTPLSRQQTGTSLPSFASFQEHANRADEPDEVEIAPMSARLTCSQCTTLQPLMREVALAVSELDELVQASCNNGQVRTSDVPRDNAVRAVQWMLERLAKSKSDLQTGLRRGLRYPDEPHFYRAAEPTEDAPNPLKRSPWSQEDLPPAKRRQSTIFLDERSRTLPSAAPRDERRRSLDFAADSPLPVESVTESAYPRTVSPGRSMKALPSPSSLAYPLSGAPSALPQAPHSLGSPATSYQPAASIHTASTSSATSAHLADLQHQVTLKSLALQTLQSEYSSLLQKLQRERVKSQTIEKKTSVADQEVNDLTSRNEELAEQVKGLESQLETSERKRENERTESAREKEQWGRMLELGGRIQSKHAEEKQKLKDEIEVLMRRVMAYEGKAGPALDAMKRDARMNGGSATPTSWDTGTRTPTAQQITTRGSPYGITNGTSSDDVASLKREVDVLTSRIEVLRFALEEARRHNQLLDEQAHEVIKRSGQLGSVVHRALQDDCPSSAPTEPRRKDAHLPPGPPALTNGQPPAEDAFGTRVPDSRRVSYSTASSSATLASMARAVSPGPAELGFHVTPSTSSPEEIIQALGPVPAPLPAFHLSTPFETPVSVKNKKGQAAGKRASKQARRQSVDVVNTWMLPPQQQAPSSQAALQHQQPPPPPQGPNIALQLGSFRPLSSNSPLPPPPAHHSPPFPQRASPPSQHSSPGPQRDGTSPHGSSGSAEADAPSYAQREQGRVQLPPMMPQQQQQQQQQRGPGFDAGRPMPPPPRPGVVGGLGNGRE